MRNLLVFLLPLVLLLFVVQDASAQIFARNRDVNINANGVQVEVDRRLFGRDRVFVNGARVDNRRNVNRGRDINVVAVPFNVAPRAVFVPTRFNAFGVAVKQDAFGNVFEIDGFGNARLAGNVFNRGFQGTVFRSSAFAFGSPFVSPQVSVFGGSCH